MSSDILLSLQDPDSKRWAIFEDDGETGWLYMTRPDSLRPASSCLVYNRQPPPQSIARDQARDAAPPATRTHASSEALVAAVSEAELEVRWASSGTAAVVLLRGDPRAMVIVGEPLGWSKALSREGPYGHPWSAATYNRFSFSHH